MKSSPRAFTLIELMIVLGIVAILSVALVVNFQGTILKSRFEDESIKVIHLLEQARSYSLTNFLVNDVEPADYYLLTVTATGLTLQAHGPSLDSTLASVTLSSDFSITNITGSPYVYYFPPTGEICFDTADCSSTINEMSFTFADTASTNHQVISVSKFGGAPEVGR